MDLEHAKRLLELTAEYAEARNYHAEVAAQGLGHGTLRRDPDEIAADYAAAVGQTTPSTLSQMKSP